MAKKNLKRKRKDTPGCADDSDVPAGGSRPARPPYSQEQDDFIRFCRDDLCQSWEGTQRLYNQHWAVDKASERKIPGLQSRYYRLLDVPVRDRKRGSLGRPELGILATTTRRYWWMAGMLTDEERAERGGDTQSTRPATDLGSSNRDTTTRGSDGAQEDTEDLSDEDMLGSFDGSQNSDEGEREDACERESLPDSRRQGTGMGKASGEAESLADSVDTVTSDEDDEDDSATRMAKIRKQLDSRVRVSHSPRSSGNADQMN
jgi:hypothetical protein